jgi:WD40 repeat protein
MSLSIYNVKENYKFISKVKFLNGVPRTIDFTDDGKIIMVSTDSNELRYYEVQKGERITLATDIEKLRFTDWTSPFGQGMSGIYSSNDGTEITCACLNASKTIIAVGLSNGNIRLYSYPCVTTDPIYTQYIGHTGPVSKILFTDDEAFLVSLGLNDRALIQWDCKRPAEEIENEEDPTNPSEGSNLHREPGLLVYSLTRATKGKRSEVTKKMPRTTLLTGLTENAQKKWRGSG